MGCYATRAPEEVAALPGVSQVVTDKRELPDLLGRFGVTDIPTGISGFGRRHRAYVKVQDGCMLRCSFCIIPYVRPHLASRPVEHILDEVRRLVDRGYREVVLTGIHLGHYGVDWNRQLRPKRADWIRLSHLVRQIAELPGDFRVRLSSIEATEVTRELIDVMADHPRQSRPAPAHLDAKRQRRACCAACAAAGAASGSSTAAGSCRSGSTGRRSRPTSSSAFPARPTPSLQETIDDRPRRRLLEDPHLPLQPAPRHAGRRDAEPGAEARAAGALARTGGGRGGTARLSTIAACIGRQLRVLVETKRRTDESELGSAHPAATRRSSLPASAADEGQFVDVIAGEVRGERIVALANSARELFRLAERAGYNRSLSTAIIDVQFS